MTSWIGAPGALVPIVCPVNEGTDRSRAVSARVAFSGARVVQVGKGVLRSWSIDYDVEHPRDLAVLDALTRWEAPLSWVGALAQATNLLTPGMASMIDAGHQGGASARTGALELDGMHVVLWAGGPVGSYVIVTGGETVPVRAGVPVTFSAWTQRAESASPVRLRYSFRDATGTAILTSEANGPAGDGLQRASWTLTPPAGAADVSLWVREAATVAAPQFTWTSTAVEWAPGRGVSQVVVVPGTESPLIAHSSNVLVSSGYTILEVG